MSIRLRKDRGLLQIPFYWCYFILFCSILFYSHPFKTGFGISLFKLSITTGWSQSDAKNETHALNVSVLVLDHRHYARWSPDCPEQQKPWAELCPWLEAVWYLPARAALAAPKRRGRPRFYQEQLIVASWFSWLCKCTKEKGVWCKPLKVSREWVCSVGMETFWKQRMRAESLCTAMTPKSQEAEGWLND